MNACELACHQLGVASEQFRLAYERLRARLSTALASGATVAQLSEALGPLAYQDGWWDMSATEALLTTIEG